MTRHIDCYRAGAVQYPKIVMMLKDWFLSMDLTGAMALVRVWGLGFRV